MNSNRKKILAVGLIVAVLLVSGAVYYFTTQLQVFRGDVRQRASETQDNWIGSVACSLSFDVAAPTNTPTATPTVTNTPTPTYTPTATPTPIPECNDECGTGEDCPSGLTCYTPDGSETSYCRLGSNPTSEVCVAPTATPTNTPTATAIPTKAPEPTYLTMTPTNTPTNTPSPTPIPECNDSCTQGDQCTDDLVCYFVNEGEGYCRLQDNPSSEQCLMPTATPTQVPGVTATNTPTPTPGELPAAGISIPGLAVFGGGLIMAIVGILLAL